MMHAKTTSVVPAGATGDKESRRPDRRRLTLLECLIDPHAERPINRALEWLAIPGPITGCMAPSYQLFGAGGLLVGLVVLRSWGLNGEFPVSMIVPAVVGAMVLFDGTARLRGLLP